MYYKYVVYDESLRVSVYCILILRTESTTFKQLPIKNIDTSYNQNQFEFKNITQHLTQLE